MYNEDEQEKGGKTPNVLNRTVKKRTLAAPTTSEKAKNIDAYMKYKSQDKEQLRGDTEIVKFLARSNLTFNLVKADGFEDFLAYFAPKMNVKKAKTYSKFK